MKVPITFIGIFLTAWLAIQGWTITSIIDMKQTIATMQTELNLKSTK